MHAGDGLHVSALSALKWPLTIVGIVAGLPLLFCLLFFSALDAGHPPGIFLPMLYLFFVTPFAAPLGAALSAVAFVRHPTVRGRALMLLVLFAIGTTVSWYWFVPFLVRGN